MGKGRNKLSLGFFVLGNGGGHIVDVVSQLPQLAGVRAGDLHAVGAGGDALGLFADKLHRAKDALEQRIYRQQGNRGYGQAAAHGKGAEGSHPAG